MGKVGHCLNLRYKCRKNVSQKLKKCCQIVKNVLIYPRNNSVEQKRGIHMYVRALLLSLILSVFAFAVTAYAEESSYSGTTFVTTSRLNLRSLPSTDSERIALVDTGRAVEVTDFRDGVWFAVVYNGQQGYMYARHLREQSEYDIGNQVEVIFITTSNLNLRPSPSTSGERIALVYAGRRVEVTDLRDGVWFAVSYNGLQGYMYARHLAEPGSHGTPGRVEMVEWSVARNILPRNTPITIIDVRTRVSYQVVSFSHGSHADVFPLTADDTETMRQTFGGSWTWTPRPILVVFDGRTVAASINGMPHGGGANRANNMNGHVCIHFLNSRTHNGNQRHENDHQNAVREAYNTASSW